MSAPNTFVVAFTHGHRSFTCVRLEAEGCGAGAMASQWIVTIEGRTIWSFDAGGGDTREQVQRAVERWWDETHVATA
jgi:hypothetical protein